MNEAIIKDMWWAYALRGAAAVLFGIVALFWPGLTLVTLVYIFGAYILVSGIVNQTIGLTNMGGGDDTFWQRILLILLGLLELGVGVYFIRHPLMTFATLVLLIGLTLLIRGLYEVFSGIFGGGSASMSRTVMIIGGSLGALAGVLILKQPASAGVAFVWILGLYALITGPLLIALAVEAKNSVPPVSGKKRTA